MPRPVAAGAWLEALNPSRAVCLDNGGGAFSFNENATLALDCRDESDRSLGRAGMLSSLSLRPLQQQSVRVDYATQQCSDRNAKKIGGGINKTYCKMSHPSRNFDSASLVGGASRSSEVEFGRPSPAVATANSSLSFRFRDRVIELRTISTSYDTWLESEK
jgi:hypothetical protein